MGLKDYRFPEEIILTAGGPLTVRGLSLPDIARLVHNHGTALAMIFAKVMEKGEAGVDVEDVQALATLLLTTAPRCLGEIIAVACGEPDEGGIAAAIRLPADVQIVVIEKVASLTFATEGGLGNVVEAVIRVSREIGISLGPLLAPQA